MTVNFTDDELSMLSDALICAINANCKAQKMMTCALAKRALTQHIGALADLNGKICAAMPHDDE